MAFTLQLNDQTIKFKPAGEYVEITRSTTQVVAIRKIETTNEWHGLWRYTDKINNQVVIGTSWTSIKCEDARNCYRSLLNEGWQPA
jgi:hypothetical protein